MKVAKSTKSSGGLAKVEIKGSKVRVTFKPEKDEELKRYTLEKENCPDYVQEGTFFVNLSANGDKMYSMRPQNGVFKLKFKEFTAQKDKEPTPRTMHKGDYSYQIFTSLFEILDGKYAGMIVPGSFSYNFQEAKEEVDGKMRSVAEISHPKSKFTAALIELLTVTGLIQKQIPFKENLLPLLQKMMLREDRVFSGSIKKGYIDSLYEDEEVEVESFE